MSSTNGPLGIRYAAHSDVGEVRESNEDVAYAGPRLFAVADGFGGGQPAGAVAIEALKPLETDVPVGDLLSALEEAARSAHETVNGLTESDPSRSGTGTTLTAMLWSGSQLALVHIGDSRAYLLRDGELFQITHDHTLVQSMVDEGRLTAEEAASHPQRSLLVRALGVGGADGFRPDLDLREARAGDRYLLCSDGLSSVVATEEVHRVIGSTPDPGEAVDALIGLANGAGGPDNVSCVVADVVDAVDGL
jgi:protein phosphatase